MDNALEWAKRKAALIEELRIKKGRTREEIIIKALNSLAKDTKIRNYEYTVSFIYPKEPKGYIEGKEDKFIASSSADAVRYVAEKFGFPAFDPLDVLPDDTSEDSKEFKELDNYGIWKVRKNIATEEHFTDEEMLESWVFIFKNLIRYKTLVNGQLEEDNNIPEVLRRLLDKYKIPTNEITEGYLIDKSLVR